MTVPVLPGGLPLVGHALAFGARPLRFLEAARDHGDVVRFRLGGRPAYLVNTPELVREVLVDRQRVFAKGGALFEIGVELMGNGLGMVNGDRHRRQRRLVRPAFTRAALGRSTEVMLAKAGELTDSWRPGQELDVNAQMLAFTTATLTAALFHSPADPAMIATFQECMPVAVRGVFRRIALPIGWLHRLPTRQNRRYRRALRRMHDSVDLVIADYRAHPRDRGDLFSTLLLATDWETGATGATGATMTDQELHDEVMSLMVAGTETTAITLSWIFHLLGAHPEVERRLYAEVDQVLAGQPLRARHLRALEYTGQVVQEALRLHSPIWMLTRNAVTEVRLGTHQVPAGAELFFSPYALQRDPRTFPEPESFDPDRWLPGAVCPRAREAHLPFGAGARKCLGDSFATMEVVTVLASVASRWRLRPTPGHRTRPTAHATYFPAGLTMTVRPRG